MLVLAGALGATLGQQTGKSSGPAKRSADTAALSLVYPDTWQRVAGGGSPPDLGLSDTVQLAGPTGPDHGGLIAGVVRGTGSAPPDLGRVADQVPPAEIVRLESGPQAFRYAKLQQNGSKRQLVLYTMPTARGPYVALACYADAADVGFLAACEQVAGAMKVLDPSGSELSPSPAYAAALNDRLGTLARERASFRKELAGARGSTGQGRVAGELATSYSTAASRLKAVPTPQVAAAAGAAVVAALERGAGAYRDLGRAAASGDRPSYRRARAAVSVAEAAVAGALRRLTTLGYRGG